VRALIPLVTSLAIALPAAAEAKSTSADFPLELQFQGVGVEPAASADLGLGVSVESVAVFDSGAPEDFGVEELLLRREGEVLSLWGGKFNPAFGHAWDQDVAVFDGHAAEYETKERLGIGAAMQWGDEEAVALQLSGSVFGNPALPSYAVSLEAQPTPGLTLNTALMHADNQRGILLGARCEIIIGERSVAPLVEVARVADALLLSTGLSIDEGGMRYTLQNSSKQSSLGDETIVQATASWTL
jgi:hypothetical protein